MQSLNLPIVPDAIAELIALNALYLYTLNQNESLELSCDVQTGYWLIGVCTGTISVPLLGQTRLLESGTAVGMCSHAIFPIRAPAEVQLLCAHLSGSTVTALLAPTLAHSPYFAHGGVTMRTYLMPLLHEADGTPANSGAAVSAIAFSLLTALYGTSVCPSVRPQYPSLVQDAIAIMQQEFAHLYGVEDLADRLEVTAPHLIRTFSQALGITPGRYLTQIRISFAKELLRGHCGTLETIAACAGFSSAHYFSKVFRRETGMSPREYMQTAPPALPTELPELYL